MKTSVWQARFVRYMRVRHWSERTVECYGAELGRFFRFLEAEGVVSVVGITRDVLEAYRTYLFHFTHRGGRLTASSQARCLSAVKAFVHFLAQDQYVLLDSGQGVELPRLPHILPRDILSEAQVETLLSVPDVTTPLGLRDRAVMESLYSTAVRNSELRALQPTDVGFERQELYIRCGKGQKSRVVPLGQEASHWLALWLKEGRPTLVRDPRETAVFVSWRGRQFTREMLSDLVGRAAKAAGLTSRVTPHLLRHCCATHMLARGAGLRHLQELLGHASPVATQRYTRIELSDLQAVHRRYHPRERGYS